MTEEVLRFGEGEGLVGVLTLPAGGSPPEAALLCLNSGVVHRVGVNRLYVRMCRLAAERGLAAFRFDFSGIGDSAVRRDRRSFVPRSIAETRQAIDVVVPRLRSQRFILLGICSGAVIAFHTACRDPRVRAAFLINPYGHLDGPACRVDAELRRQVRRHHYLRLALKSSFRRKIWGRLLAGRIDFRPIVDSWKVLPRRILAALRDGTHQVGQQAEGWDQLRQLIDRGVRIVEIHAEADEGLDYLHLKLGDAVDRLAQGTGADLITLAGANHTFTALESQARLMAIVDEWLPRLAADPSTFDRARATGNDESASRTRTDRIGVS